MSGLRLTSLHVVFNEEYKRQKELLSIYKDAIEKLPGGSISIKKINGKEYAYRKYWSEGKTKTEYIGSVDSNSVSEIKNQLEEFKKLKNKIKHSKALIMQMEKGFRAST